MKLPNIKELTQKCYDASRAGGWHNDPVSGNPRTDEENRHMFSARISLIHSELSEGLEGDRRVEPLKDDKLPERFMAEVELADAIIRICDLAGCMNIDMAQTFGAQQTGGWRFMKKTDLTFPKCLAEIHESVSFAHCHFRINCFKAQSNQPANSALPETKDTLNPSFGDAYYLGKAVAQCFDLGEAMGFDVMTAIDEKIAFNAIRQDHKHENRVKKNGKKY